MGQKPLQKTLKSGRTVTMFSLGTGGIRNNRRPLDNEDPREYANRCAVQWHRVSVYPDRLGGIVNKHVVPGWGLNLYFVLFFSFFFFSLPIYMFWYITHICIGLYICKMPKFSVYWVFRFLFFANLLNVVDKHFWITAF